MNTAIIRTRFHLISILFLLQKVERRSEIFSHERLERFRIMDKLSTLRAFKNSTAEKHFPTKNYEPFSSTCDFTGTAPISMDDNGYLDIYYFPK